MSEVAIIDYDFDMAPHQEEFIFSPAKFLLNSGGVGSGKSFAIILKTLYLVVHYPGIKILVTDSNWPSLRDTTYADFQDLVPPEIVINHNRATHLFKFTNGSRVRFRVFDRPFKAKRYTFGAIACEELVDLGEEYFKILRTRLRQPGYPGLFYAATNPSTFQNWVYKLFIQKPIKNSHVIYSRMRDNTFLDEEYIEDMDAIADHDEAYHRRMVEAEWGTIEGLVYELPKKLRTVPKNIEYDTYIVGVDFGYEHPTAIVVVGVRNDTRFDAIEEVYQQYITSDDIIELCSEICERYDVFKIWGDGARPEIIQDMVDAGLPAEAALKGAGSVFAGVLRLKGLIKKGFLRISKACENGLKEVDSYVWAKPDRGSPREQPEDANNHFWDAIRYSIVSYLRNHVGDVEYDKILEIQKRLG